MEDDLDKIAEGKSDWVKILRNFYNEFEPAVKEAFVSMSKKNRKNWRIMSKL